ncbi:MAG: prepilin-type N-terminal cleavage/methylation domain-containing protein [Luteimonas sp.]
MKIHAPNQSRLHSGPRHARGFSLIELMIALVLGLLVVGAAAGIFVSNQRTFRSAQNLGSLQQNARTAFELMGRDLREASGNSCVNNAPVGNVLNAAAVNWYTNFVGGSTAVQGYSGAVAPIDLPFGTAAGQRVAGTDAIQMLSADADVATISAHDTAGAVFTVTGTHNFSRGDIMIACNARQASVFQASAVSGQTISNGTGAMTPGNCTTGLGLETLGVCNASAKVFQFAAPNSVLAKLRAVRWYIGNNANGGRSLYQSHLRGGNPAGVTNDEIAEGAQNMTITYLLRGGNDYVPAVAVGDWGNVLSMRIELALQSTDSVGTDGAPITRRLIQVASLRNRNP